MKEFIKQNLFKIITSAILIALVSYSIWSWFLLRKVVQIDNNQGNQIILQGAAWQVFFSSLDENAKQNFTNAVNQLLKN